MKFTILIPAYKAAFFDECLKSVFSQTYADFEVVVVDDASPEDLKSVADTLADPRMTYHRNPSGYGAVELVKNWNNALALCHGDYLMCIGDDDRLLPNCLEDLAREIDLHPGLDLYHTRMEVINEHGEIIDIQLDRPDFENVYSMIYHWIRGRRQCLGEWVFRTETLKARGGFFYTPCAWAADDFSAILAAKDTGVRNLHRPGFQYRQSSLSVTKSYDYSMPKIQAWNIVRTELESLLADEPADEIDRIHRRFALQRIPHFFRTAKLTEVKKDMYAGTGLKALWRWLKQCKRVGLSRKQILATYAYRYIESLRSMY